MRAAVALGLRLTRAGGRLRGGLVISGTAVGVAVLMLAFALPMSLLGGPQDPLSRDEQRLAAVVVLSLAVPVVVLLLTVSRLSAAARDRRLAALRLLGVSPLRTQVASATEAALLAAAGTAVGALAFLLALRPGLTALDGRWRHWMPQGLRLDSAPAVLVAIGVPLLSVLVSLAPARALVSAATGVRRTADVRRPTLWRLAPLVVGVVLLVVALTQRPQNDSGPSRTCFVSFFAGAAIAGMGVPLAVPVAVRWLADLALRQWRRPGVLLAARRLQVEPAATSRVIAALMAAAFVIVGARCVLVSFEQTPQYIRAHLAATTGPQQVSVSSTTTDGTPDAHLDSPDLRRTLLAVPGVRAVVPRRGLTEDKPWDVVPARVHAVVATCADLAAFVAITGCVEGQPVWLETRYEAEAAPDGYLEQLRRDRAAVAGHEVRLVADEAASNPFQTAKVASVVHIRLPADASVITVSKDDPNWSPFSGDLLVPPGYPGVRQAAGPPRDLTVVAAGGSAVVSRIEAVTAPLGLTTYGEDTGALDFVEGYRAILWAVAGILLGVGLLALLVAAVDRAVARRREVAALVALGVPLRTVRLSQLLQTGLPLVLGLPAAGAAGLLAGAAYLGIDGDVGTLPWRAALQATTLAASAAGLAALCTLLGIGRPTSPDLLRRE